jgi:CBS domain containing-hemolysin-like protein
MSLTVQLLFLLLLILINAFFASAEMAVVSVNKNRIKILAQDGNKKAKLLLKLYDEPNKFLSTIQVAITLAGFLASAVAATSMSDDIAGFLASSEFLIQLRFPLLWSRWPCPMYPWFSANCIRNEWRCSIPKK